MVYDYTIKPINGRTEWMPTGFQPLLPPVIGRQAGRPANARRREPDEPLEKQKKRPRGRPSVNPLRSKRNQTTVKCSKCHQSGHNKRGCKSDVAQTNVNPSSGAQTNAQVIATQGDPPPEASTYPTQDSINLGKTLLA
ncbi:hypothetical protein ACS0TY_006335 [Phlomoides rotata]